MLHAILLSYKFSPRPSEGIFPDPLVKQDIIVSENATFLSSQKPSKERSLSPKEELYLPPENKISVQTYFVVGGWS